MSRILEKEIIRKSAWRLQADPLRNYELIYHKNILSLANNIVSALKNVLQ